MCENRRPALPLSARGRLTREPFTFLFSRICCAVSLLVALLWASTACSPGPATDTLAPLPETQYGETQYGETKHGLGAISASASAFDNFSDPTTALFLMSEQAHFERWRASHRASINAITLELYEEYAREPKQQINHENLGPSLLPVPGALLPALVLHAPDKGSLTIELSDVLPKGDQALDALRPRRAASSFAILSRFGKEIHLSILDNSPKSPVVMRSFPKLTGIEDTVWGHDESELYVLRSHNNSVVLTRIKDSGEIREDRLPECFPQQCTLIRGVPQFPVGIIVHNSAGTSLLGVHQRKEEFTTVPLARSSLPNQISIKRCNQRFVISRTDREKSQLLELPKGILYGAQSGFRIESFECLPAGILLTERMGALATLRYLPTRDLKNPRLIFSLKGEIEIAPTTLEGSTKRAVHLSSPIEPGSWVTVDEMALPPEINGAELSNETSDKLQMRLLEIVARDGTLIPVSLLESSTLRAAAPLVTEIYGAYGTRASLEFKASRIPLLRRGVRIALVHSRGGGWNGPAWHEYARSMHKERAGQDVYDVMQGLIKQNVAQSEQIFVMTRSAGAVATCGALSHSAANIRGLVFDMPLFDVLRGVTDPKLPLMNQEQGEWGDPADPALRRAIERYNPLYRCLGARLPPALVVTSLADEVVPPSDAMRWVAVARARSFASEPTLLNIAEDARHSESSSLETLIERQAVALTFVLSLLAQ